MRLVTPAAVVAALLLLVPAAGRAATPQLSFTEADGGVFVVSPSGGTATSLLSAGVLGAFSPDGTRVAFFSNGRLLVAQADGTSPKRLASGIATTAGLPTGGPPSWSPNSRQLAYSDGDALHVVNATGRGGRTVNGSTNGFVDGATHPVWSHSGTALYYLAINQAASVQSSVQQLYRVPVSGGKSPAHLNVAFPPSTTLEPFSLAISPSGRTLAVTLGAGAGQFGVGLVPVTGGQATMLPGLTAAAFSPSGTQLCAQTTGEIVVTTLGGAVTATATTTVGATGCAWTQ
jgi:Tol biopolymer transport system component